MEIVELRAHSYAMIFDLANRFQVLMDRELATDGITAKQWYLVLCIERGGDREIRLSEVARLSGTSRQNVKQIALKLERRGFLAIRRDPGDRRGLLLSITEKCRDYWKGRSPRDGDLLERLFGGLNRSGLESLYRNLAVLSARTEQLEKNE